MLSDLLAVSLRHFEHAIDLGRHLAGHINAPTFHRNNRTAKRLDWPYRTHRLLASESPAILRALGFADNNVFP